MYNSLRYPTLAPPTLIYIHTAPSVNGSRSSSVAIDVRALARDSDVCRLSWSFRATPPPASSTAFCWSPRYQFGIRSDSTSGITLSAVAMISIRFIVSLYAIVAHAGAHLSVSKAGGGVKTREEGE